MFQSWYIAADFQLYVVSLLVVYMIWRWPRLGYAVLGLLMTLSAVIPFVLIYQNQAAPLLFPYPE
jgi:peptidoglycan/LPS O-acetylase OafA/YrhL